MSVSLYKMCFVKSLFLEKRLDEFTGHDEFVRKYQIGSASVMGNCS